MSDVIFFFNDAATTEIYTLSLHDALPISSATPSPTATRSPTLTAGRPCSRRRGRGPKCSRSEEHTSELQSRQYLVCRLLLEKKNDAVHLQLFFPPLADTHPPIRPPAHLVF